MPAIADALKMDNRVVSIEPLSGYRFRVTYVDGETYELDWSEQLDASGWTGELKDPAVFNAVKIGEGGRWIEWPNGYDFCADALRWDGELARRGLKREDVTEKA
jgi:hypothetical protein